LFSSTCENSCPIGVLAVGHRRGARQISTGDRTILGKVSKQGNRYLRVLFVQAAWVVLISRRRGSVTGSSNGLQPRRGGPHPNVLAIALANELARIRELLGGSYATTSETPRESATNSRCS
jgi:transposase